MSTPCKAPFSLVLFVLGALAAGTGCAASSGTDATEGELALTGGGSDAKVQLVLDESADVALDREAQDVALGREKLEAEPELTVVERVTGREAAELEPGVGDLANAQKPLVRPTL